MEFGYSRRRDGYYCEKDGEQEDSSSSNPHISIPSTSTFYPSSSSSTTAAVEKEHMFDKVVTPSDVGKLNRLVIPKQHAERCFPFDASANEKGLHLNFEDRTGKPWRFRYSYWNSSQSYVMTKGWSRFVKEKRLNAGDTVSFARDAANLARMFIDWKRRPDILEPPPLLLHTRNPFSFSPRFLVPNTLYHQHQQISYGYTNVISPTVLRVSGQYPVYRSAQMVLDSVPVVPSGRAATKRVRLFGVNLDFQENEVPLQQGRAESSRIFSSSSSSPSALGKEDRLSLDLDI